jgi:hypothetical protein
VEEARHQETRLLFRLAFFFVRRSEVLTVTYLELRRRQIGFTQKELGDQRTVRIAQYFISMCERGTGVPTPDQRDRLARFLNIKSELLLQQVPEGTPVPEDVTAASEHA